MSVFSCPTTALLSEKKALYQAMRQNETQCVQALVGQNPWTENDVKNIQKQARKWVTALRKKRLSGLSLDAFFMQYQLSSEEGIALMCLAEALLRIPDKRNIDTLIADKISDMDWLSQTGKSDSFLVNASTWGLAIGSKVVTRDKRPSSLTDTLQNITSRLSNPILRQAIKQSMALLGQQFVMGESIEEACQRAEKTSNQVLHSYDMLGEGAKTHADAERYFQAYQHAIDALKSPSAATQNVFDRPSISVKLSALHPRYEWSHQAACVPALAQKLEQLALQAKAANVGLTMDAEEADRLDLSLMIFEQVFASKALTGWHGLGLAIQAYLRATSATIDWLAALAKQHDKKIPVRLVKGAYWDTEVKDTQVRGLDTFPVFTRKIYTDVHYLACMQKMIDHIDWIYPQFATHNAFSVAAVLQALPNPEAFEFQCLHGMGETLYEEVLQHHPKLRCRHYAPVGKHADLLPYLVRRLLENGANSSFVNQILNPDVPIKTIIANPYVLAKKRLDTATQHPAIATPKEMFGDDRPNSTGYNLHEAPTTLALTHAMNTYQAPKEVGPIVKGVRGYKNCEHVDIRDPANHERVLTKGYLATADQVTKAIGHAQETFVTWHQTPIKNRATILRQAAQLLQARQRDWMALCVREAGKIWEDAVDEIREAIDFLEYYATLAEQTLQPKVLPGPTGEENRWQPQGRGVFLCISPWNFPLAIFTGQVAAALVAGNTVLAKPATQTMAIAHEMVKLFYEAGLPKGALQLLPGRRDVIGQPLLQDPRVQGVMLTGSTATGKMMAQTLAERPGLIVPLIAETGGQNAMIVDSTALPEQVVQDVVDSAFKSAGQRCSALRILFIQEDIADKIITMLKGAMATLTIGDPVALHIDIGPVIDQKALNTLQNHQKYLAEQGAKKIAQCEMPDGLNGFYFAPAAYELDNIDILSEEVFGPILHIVRFKGQDIHQVMDQINATGYGLTLGIHSRIERTVKAITQRARVGNIYVNRNMIGAVVGVQPFGGEGLSGTGPKAGGPWYLTRLCREQTISINTTAVGGNASLMSMTDET